MPRQPPTCLRSQTKKMPQISLNTSPVSQPVALPKVWHNTSKRIQKDRTKAQVKAIEPWQKLFGAVVRVHQDLPQFAACVPHLQTFSVPGPPANFKHSAAALSTLAKAATLQPRPLTVSIGFRNCCVARFGNPRPSRVPYTLHVWSIALLGRFERSPPKLKVPNQK